MACGRGWRSSAGLNRRSPSVLASRRLHELLEGKVDALIEGSLRRHPGYRSERVEDGFLIVPLGTADCAEVETLTSWR